MSSDVMIQELLIRQSGRERLQKAVQRDLIQIAVANRPSRITRMLDTLGAMLIAVGESLLRQPAISSGNRSTLSYSKT